MRVRPIQTLLAGLCLAGAACATPAAGPDDGEIARAVLEEQIAAARMAIKPSQSVQPPEPTALPKTPIWAPTERGMQHIASGFSCPPEASGFKHIGQDVFPGLGAGQDVACVYENAEQTRVKLHLTNFNRSVNPAAHLKGVRTTITDTGAQPIALAADRSLPAHAAAFELAPSNSFNDPGFTHTAVWIDTYGPWHVKARASYTPEQFDAVTTLVDRLFVRARETLAQPTPAPLP